MKVLHLIASVNAKSGGPIAYAVNMAHERAKLGHTSQFVTIDEPNAASVNHFPFPVVAVGKKSSAYKSAVETLAKDCDVAIVHGLWNKASILGYRGLTQTKTPWVLFPHGMLDPYFRKIKPFKHIIKQIYWSLWQGRMLTNAHKVLFTSEEEKRLAKNAFIGHNQYKSGCPAYCAADQRIEGDLPTKTYGWEEKIAGAPYLLYLSRIHPKKAIDNLLTAFLTVTDESPSIKLVIAGPDDSEYAKSLKDMAASLGLTEKIVWTGMIEQQEKQKAFASAEAFVLPSHQENFGQVVAEALSCGVPVLISNKINIWREIEMDGAAIVGEDTVGDTTRVLREFLTIPAAEKTKMRAAARPCYERRFSTESAARDLMTALQEAVDESTSAQWPSPLLS